MTNEAKLQRSIVRIINDMADYLTEIGAKVRPNHQPSEIEFALDGHYYQLALSNTTSSAYSKTPIQQGKRYKHPIVMRLKCNWTNKWLWTDSPDCYIHRAAMVVLAYLIDANETGFETIRRQVYENGCVKETIEPEFVVLDF